MKSDYTPSWKLPELPAFMQHKEKFLNMKNVLIMSKNNLLYGLIFLFSCSLHTYGNTNTIDSVPEVE
ncbi:MAG: hypothetical protein LBU51_00385, partial [Bacteroidales bacterium]|nr:hypothetical protein [Bacteroidales bacterium]